MKVDDENDFGFTLVSEEEALAEPNAKAEELISQLTAKQLRIEDLEQRLVDVEKLIMPLITNLMKKPEKEMIKWPGPERIPRLTKFAEDLKAITRRK